MPVPPEERPRWLARLSDSPQDAFTEVAALVRDDLDGLADGQVLRMGTRVLNGAAGQSFVLALLRGNDVVELSDLAKQYIETATIDEPQPGQ